MPSKCKNSPAPGLYKLDAAKLTLGDPLPGALCTIDGRVILREGLPLKPEVLHRLRNRLESGIFGGAEWPECFHAVSQPKRSSGVETADPSPEESAPTELVTISIDKLEPGMRLGSNLYTNRGALLLTHGAEVTAHLLAKLRQYRIFEVQLGAPEPSASTESAEPESSETRSARCRRVPTSDAGTERCELSLADLRAELTRGKVLYEDSIERVGEILEDAFQGKKSCTTGLRQIISDFMGFLRMDSSLLPSLVQVGETPPEYLYQHGLNVALMAMSVATTANVPEDQIPEIGMGAMMQDLGMMSVPGELRFAPRSLTEAERAEVERHPTYTVDLLQRLGVPDTSLMIAYQAHERPDRSGYPNGRHRMLIHPLARLVSAADAYVALSSKRAHRPNRSPYEAMRVLLAEANENRQDADAVRAILDSLSLFPLGSYVTLSDGNDARVVRANPGKHTRPVVVVLNTDGTETACEVDLARSADLKIVKALESAPGLAAKASLAASPALVA